MNVALMGETMKNLGHHGVSKDDWPFADAETSGDDDTSLLLKLAQEVEIQRASVGAKRQVSSP